MFIFTNGRKYGKMITARQIRYNLIPGVAGRRRNAGFSSGRSGGHSFSGGGCCGGSGQKR